MVPMECPFPSTTRDSGMKLMIVQLVMCNSTCKFWLVEFHSCFQMAVGEFSYKCVDMYIDTQTHTQTDRHTHTHTHTDRHTHTHCMGNIKLKQGKRHYTLSIYSVASYTVLYINEESRKPLLQSGWLLPFITAVIMNQNFLPGP